MRGSIICLRLRWSSVWLKGRWTLLMFENVTNLNRQSVAKSPFNSILVYKPINMITLYGTLIFASKLCFVNFFP